MSDVEKDIQMIDGVHYTTEYAGALRVVFKHNADSNALKRVEELTGCSGKLGATQEHLPASEYPLDEIGT